MASYKFVYDDIFEITVERARNREEALKYLTEDYALEKFNKKYMNPELSIDVAVLGQLKKEKLEW
jgi:hypothetical protein